MSCRLPKLRRLSAVGLAVVALSFPVLGGCARRPSQQEISLLEEQRMAAEAAEMKVAELQSEKATLEQEIAEKQATKRALEEKLETVRNAVANWPSE